MTLNANTLRPGLLVAMATSLKGNVRYLTRDIEAEHYTADGKRKAVWETEKLISDPAEHEAAIKARSKARGCIIKSCFDSAFGLLCPESEAENLEKAIREARSIVSEFNRNARLSRIRLSVIVGRIAADDLEAVRAINGEVRDLLSDMESGVRNLDVKVIREAANKARSIGQMLTPEAQVRIQGAIDAARETARKIVKAGEQAGMEIDKATLVTLETARTAFLDLDSDESSIGMPEAESRPVDFMPSAMMAETQAAPEAGEPQEDKPAMSASPEAVSAPDGLPSEAESMPEADGMDSAPESDQLAETSPVALMAALAAPAIEMDSAPAYEAMPVYGQFNGLDF